MNRLVTWFVFSIKRQLKRPMFYAVFLLFLLAEYILIIVEKPENQVGVIGIYGNRDVEDVNRILTALFEKKYGLRFLEAETEEEAENMVETLKVDCGFSIPDDLTQRLQNDDCRDLLTFYYGSNSLRGSVAKEVIFTEVYKIYGELFLSRLTDGDEIFLEHSVTQKEEVMQAYRKYLSDGSTFSLSYDWTAPDEVAFREEFENMQEMGTGRGGIAFLLLVTMLFLAGEKFEEGGLFLILDMKRGFLYRLVSLFAIGFLFLLPVLYVIGRGGIKPVLFEAFYLLLYLLLCCIWSLGISSFFKSAISYYAALPLGVVAILILSPVFFQIGDFVPVLNGFRWLFPTTYYVIW